MSYQDAVRLLAYRAHLADLQQALAMIGFMLWIWLSGTVGLIGAEFDGHREGA